MALVRVTNQIFHDPKAVEAFHKAFDSIERIPAVATDSPFYILYRCQSVAQNLPKDDTLVELVFERSLEGKARVKSWYKVGKNLGVTW